MSRPRTQEQRLLATARQLLEHACCEVGPTARVEVLEACAAAHGGWSIDEYRQTFPRAFAYSADTVRAWGEKLSDLLTSLPLPISLAVSALAQPELPGGDQRRAGAYYTDFRLAQYLAAQFVLCDLTPDDRVIDVAAGSGMLLAALTMKVSQGHPDAAARFIADNVCAADLHEQALVATRLTLSTLVADLDPLVRMQTRLLSGDSLTRGLQEWDELAPGGFAAVIGNPPWEKLKVTRHEHLKANGAQRHYGATYRDVDHVAYDDERIRMLAYVDDLTRRTALQGSGEADLYKLFFEVAARLVRPGGELGLLVPAGLIRSQGTQELRAFLFQRAPELTMTILENRAAFFAIDTRFKFLALHAKFHAGDHRQPIILKHAAGTDTGVVETGVARIGRSELKRMRADLTVPEVRSTDELRLFTKLVDGATTLADDQWRHSYMREVDMTNDRGHFLTRRTREALPLMEGRLVHQHRAMAKAYLSGTGRAARWTPLAPDNATLRPQFWYPRTALSPTLAARTDVPRAGFCDVTGQTNERTLLAAVIPSGVVCGNKVPTLTFDIPRLTAEDGALLWVAVANSLPVDWATRRVVTTSMNYFLLLSLPLPALDESGQQSLVEASRTLCNFEGARDYDPWQAGIVRAEIDSTIALAFGLAVEDLNLMLSDFRLLDRGQPPLPGESASTITRDLLIATHAKRMSVDCREWQDRAERARQLGAAPYVPADYA